MKIFVAIKRVVDPYVRVHVRSDHTGVETANVKMTINPFDEIAVEEAVRLKEKGIAQEIIVATLGPPPAQDILRHALALGADRAIHVVTEESLEPLSVAKGLKAIIEKEGVSLVLLGKQAIDDDCNQVGQMVSALLEWPQATFASNITCVEDQLHVTREVDGGLETLALSLPAVVTTDLRLNTPRYATLPNIMKARQKPLATLSLSELGVLAEARLKILKVTPPLARSKGVMVESITELAEKIYDIAVGEKKVKA